MLRKLSTLLKVDGKEFQKKGIFDSFIDIDSRLHIDPGLLSKSTIPEFKDSHAIFQEYFRNVGILISNSKQRGDTFWREAHRKLQFRERANTALGYSKGGTFGNAIGPILATKMLDTVTQIFEAGINDPIIFELVGMIEDGIGADRISDMTISILLENFAKYTQRLCSELSIKTRSVKIKGEVYLVPYDYQNKRALLFVPRSLLNNLPIAIDWDDIDRVGRYNEELRQRVNKLIGVSWKAASKMSKKQLKQILLKNPELLIDLIDQYKRKIRTSYDFENDPVGEVIWAELSESAIDSHPLDLSPFNPITADNIIEVVKRICEQYASLIENNGWFEYLYDDNGKLKVERSAQLLFYGIAEVYCIANDLDLNREINGGVGSLDFKISRGFKSKVNVELKYSTNSSLIKGFEIQLPTYNKAEKTDTSIFLIIQTKENRKNIDKVLALAESMRNQGQRSPEVIIIDGRKQISASKRR
ncbi:hypothetical protein SAMN04487996_117152 [Dyadobacter soli]|uniref:Uncharacterized protein n=1 Tax=Dyadobacter soli TaxID=659014 RepID=A0A1G7TAM2_9BACT|nr:hypothetical protein [Dyadobacter soli]SDG32346.1 hypothetical protein SAMN04487996_117152 [Dyadobacter soli]